MNKNQLVTYLERIDAALPDEAMLYVYGSAAFILLDEPERTSLDVDVAAAVRSLPPPFNEDAVVIENLENLRNDMAIWTGSPA